MFASKVRFHIDQSMAQPKGERWRYFRERLRGLSDAAAMRGGKEAVLQPKLRTQIDRSVTRYAPPDYDGDVMLFQPEEHPIALDFIEDWRKHVKGTFEAFTLPGGHRTMLEMPHVETFAQHVRDGLARAAAADAAAAHEAEAPLRLAS